MLLKDRNAIVYGAGGAVGGAVAKALAGQGARVFLSGRTREPLERLAAAISGSGGTSHVAPVDAVDGAAVAAHLEGIVARAGPVRIMFNSVGLDDIQGIPLTELDRERFFAPILKAMQTWFTTGTTIARHMAAHGGGVIIGISANAAREAYANVGGFGVATGAIEHFIRQLAVENGPFGVRVCCVRSPGSPDSPGVREVFGIHAAEQGITLEEFIRKAGSGVPLRHLSSLAEIADAVVLLASDLARAMTATVANATAGAQMD
jgi:7-alpha-hydroxysteroid dehydrogenase